MLIGNDFTDAHRVIYTSSPTTLSINGQEVKVLCSNNTSAASMATIGLKGRWRTKAGKAAGTPVKFSGLGVDLKYATGQILMMRKSL